MLSSWAILGAYMSLLTVLALYGAHRVYLLILLHRHSRSTTLYAWETLPRVTVQLPVYNEPTVIRRLIDATAAMDWPRDRLQIQVLDDSTDVTCTLADAAAVEWRARGLDISVIRRTSRTGYKAGALAHGLRTATGEFVAIMDADFVPPSDFLSRVLPMFTPDVGMVQARWGHLNRTQTWLTRLQALLLDGHFVIEHAARHQADRFFNFNGTAGIWRRTCIEDAGGWTHDTITEDLDLSYRAQLRGWRFIYLPDLVVPAELPLGMPAFLTQQHRWAKGTIQTARKLLPQILSAPLPLAVRLEALIHLTCPIGYPLLLLLAVLLPPVVAARAALGLDALHLVDLVAVSMTTGSMVLFFCTALARQGLPWRGCLLEVPAAMALGAGIAGSQTLAVLDGLVRTDTTFVRTPKHGSRSGPVQAPAVRSRPTALALTLIMAVYYMAAIPWALDQGHWGSTPFMLLFGAGFGSVAIGLLPRLTLARPSTGAATETGGVPAAK